MISVESCQRTETAVPLDFPLNAIKRAPEFSGINFTGINIDATQYQGTVWVAYFMFTSCPGQCPVMNSKIAELQTVFKDQNVKFAAFTVDPENDTIERLSKYAGRYGANSVQWSMIRMSLDSVKILAAKGFLLGSPEEPILHSTRFALVDTKGMIRGYFDGMDEKEVVKLQKAIAFLLHK